VAGRWGVPSGFSMETTQGNRRSRAERRDKRPGQNLLHACVPRPPQRPHMLIAPTAPPRAARDRPESGRSDAEEMMLNVLLNSPPA
jgi:hypothetical protein